MSASRPPTVVEAASRHIARLPETRNSPPPTLQTLGVDEVHLIN
ncbi:MAG: hypothetical protein WCP28_00515 [Actinomycetes bacterium]